MGGMKALTEPPVVAEEKFLQQIANFANANMHKPTYKHTTDPRNHSWYWQLQDTAFDFCYLSTLILTWEEKTLGEEPAGSVQVNQALHKAQRATLLCLEKSEIKLPRMPSGHGCHSTKSKAILKCKTEL